MKVSVNWINEFTPVSLPVDELVEKIGAQLGAVEEVVDLGKKYQGIILAKVVECVKHPDADKLHVCKIDDGGAAKNVKRDGEGLVQVVCGAPNVREGLLVAWLPPGATVPSTITKEPLVLEARELRGVVSNGMLASAAELAIGDDHNGIVELNPHDGKPGDDFAKTYKLDDTIIDIENKMFTHRPDCFGMLGVAREIAGIQGKQFVSPDWYRHPANFRETDPELEVVVKNELPELVPRFMIVPLTVDGNGPSPFWMQTYLARVGLRPINTLVDITNYVMTLTSQPLHAYDYDKVKALSDGTATIAVRHPKKGEKIKLLGGKEIQPRAEAIMIATDKHLIGVGGVMGGADTEVDVSTKNIILECGTFDMYSTRRTSMENGLFTDAVTRFNKGQSPLQNDRVVAFTVDLIKRLAGGKVAGPVHDDKNKYKAPKPIETTAEFINDRLGLELSAAEMAKLLQNVEFEAYASGKSLTIAAPFWRTDIEIAEDIVEEVGRLYGYDKLPTPLPPRTVKPTARNASLDFNTKVRNVLAAAGASEVLTYSFVHGNLFEKTGQASEHAYELSNALSPDLQYFRQSLMPSLLDKVHPNLKAGAGEFALFEINKAHNLPYTKQTGEKLPAEMPLLALVYAANKTAVGGSPYYQTRKYLTALCQHLGLKPVFTAIDKEPDFPITQPFDHKRSAMVTDANSGTYLGIVGEFKASVRRNLKLPSFAAGFELGIEDLMKAASAQDPYTTQPRFPSVQQDMTLRVPGALPFQDLFSFVEKSLDKSKPENTLMELSPADIYLPKGKTENKNITVRLKLASYDRTLKADEVNSLLDGVAAQANKKFAAERI